MHLLPAIHSSAYGWLMLAGIIVSLVMWSRIGLRDHRLMLIYLAALTGAFFGAKLVFLASEGWLYWHDPDRWVIFATGKSITGALLGGYLTVELAKQCLNYSATTGDTFALIAPVGIMLGRVGCMIHGCCLGRPCDLAGVCIRDPHGVLRWPASQMEFAFNAVMLIIVLILRHKNRLPGQRFHVYLMAYGIFRFFHEFLRDTPVIVGPFSGYQFAALCIFLLGLAGFICRRSRPTVPCALNL